MHRLLEIAAFHTEAALIAAAAGADRIELCSGYAEGGLTPSEGIIRAVKAGCSIPVFLMIRPRGGDFAYSRTELDVMKYDIERGLTLGADGFVFGVMRTNGSVNENDTRALVALTGDKPVTFHRAFDTCYDPFEALETLTGCGVKRILSSGQKSTAEEGAELLQQLHEKAAGRILLLPGAGITPSNIRAIAQQTRCTEFHASAKRILPKTDSFGFGENVLPHPAIIAELKEKLLL